ncbi:GNAT family protein [Actinopolymorpha sp. NPDC004070]|uniref:GNAT family N-acetyltransferase n=1 Tax=Actinopolymorpha sp. NPDC004070 TaxID=3154548 RepID=UPI0033BF48F4
MTRSPPSHCRRTAGEVAPLPGRGHHRSAVHSRNEQPDRLDLAVVDQYNGACVGEVVLNEWDEPNRGCNLRIALVAAGQGRGLGTEAVRLMVAHGFEQLGLHRISLNVYDFNPRARRAYEKVGFVWRSAVRRPVPQRWLGVRRTDEHSGA